MHIARLIEELFALGLTIEMATTAVDDGGLKRTLAARSQQVRHWIDLLRRTHDNPRASTECEDGCGFGLWLGTTREASATEHSASAHRGHGRRGHAGPHAGTPEQFWG